MEIFETEHLWDGILPKTLVVACSDGRLQEEVDEFLRTHLAVRHYDRLYVPGGAGALALEGAEDARAERYRSDARFLVVAHGVERAILIFHGPAVDGPADAVCGEYQRRLESSDALAIRCRQDRDAEQIWRDGLGDSVDLEIYRCEVANDGLVRFVPLRR